MGTIPISISPFFWVFAGGLGWLYSGSLGGAVLWVIVILLSLLVHEYGHALTARYFGQQASIAILPFGGITQRYGKRLSLGKEFIIVLNGPLAGFALAAVSYLLLQKLNPQTQPMTYYFSLVLLRINIFWTVINLLPVGPLDGGQLLRISLEALFGLSGVRIAHIIGVVAGVALGVFFLSVNFFIGAALFFILAFESGRAWKEMQEMTPADTNEDLQQMYQHALDLSREGCSSAAIDLLRRIRQEARAGVLDRASAQAEASLLADEERQDEALRLLDQYRNKLDFDGMLLYQQLAFAAEQWEQALKIGTALYREDPLLAVAVLNARSSGRLGNGREAAGWLESAKQEGVEDLATLIAERDFDLVRNYPRIQQIL